MVVIGRDQSLEALTELAKTSTNEVFAMHVPTKEVIGTLKYELKRVSPQRHISFLSHRPIALRQSQYFVRNHTIDKLALLTSKPAKVQRMPGKTVLIVDDSSAIRNAIRFLFEQASDFVICDEAENGLEGIEKAEVLQPDVILLDLKMPKLNGAEAASVLRRLVPNAKMIFLTMYDEAAHSLASAVGVNAVISKVDGLSSLVERVRVVLNYNWECSAARAAH
jgi:CheY-like chemotaxis protein